jgi:hypothetical protein
MQTIRTTGWRVIAAIATMALAGEVQARPANVSPERGCCVDLLAHWSGAFSGQDGFLDPPGSSTGTGTIDFTIEDGADAGSAKITGDLTVDPGAGAEPITVHFSSPIPKPALFCATEVAFDIPPSLPQLLAIHMSFNHLIRQVPGAMPALVVVAPLPGAPRSFAASGVADLRRAE